MTARVHHGNLWGTRQAKYDWLNDHDVDSTTWDQLDPQPPFYLFVPQDTERLSEYTRFPLLTDVFPLNGVGLTTARDHVVIDFEPEPLVRRAGLFRDSRDSDAALCEKLGIPMKKGWHIPRARALIQSVDDLSGCVHPILYRPFDERLIFYHDSLVWRTVKQIMRHMLAGENLGLAVGRQGQVIGPETWDLVYCSPSMTEFNMFRRGGNNLFPLYLYPEGGRMLQSSPWPAGRDGRRPNLAPDFVEAFAGRLGLKFVSDGQGDLKRTFGPEDVFGYAYAVFHCPTYRSRYAEFLKFDFPRLPLTADRAVFARLVGFGRELVGLHLLEAVPDPQATYPQAGDSTVTRTGKAAYKPPTDQGPGRVYVNDAQYFDNVPPEVWDFHVGGYQVCAKWLKDRKGRTLSYDDIEHYCKMTEAVRQTLRLMEEIDRSIPTWPLE